VVNLKKWKIAFIILASFNLLCILLIGGYLFIPAKTDKQVLPKVSNQDETVPFLIKSDKESLTKLINHYLEEETDQENLQYRVDINNYVNVYGAIKAFNKTIDMQLVLKPKVISDGNLQLQVKELSIGRFQLPVSYVLTYMNTHYDLPSYVKINSNKKVFNIYLNELTLKNGFTARAESFDLEEDNINFTLNVPLP